MAAGSTMAEEHAGVQHVQRSERVQDAPARVARVVPASSRARADEPGHGDGGQFGDDAGYDVAGRPLSISKNRQPEGG